MDSFQFKEMTLIWLNGGVTKLDGGAMFGVVPKPLWSKKYPVNENNQIELPTDPILIQYHGHNIMIDAGIGNNRLSYKQKRNFGVESESKIEENLSELGLTVLDIDIIMMTHLHYDHVTGLSKKIDENNFETIFKNAIIYVNDIEWQEMKQPNIRSKNTYWQENWVAIENQVKTFHDSIEILPGIMMKHTGGHSEGHSIIILEQEKETMIHMADLMPTHAHQNPLWVLAYDDYPMTSIFQKENLLKNAYENHFYFTFYHDAYYRMVQWDKDGKEIHQFLKRGQEATINF